MKLEDCKANILVITNKKSVHPALFKNFLAISPLGVGRIHRAEYSLYRRHKIVLVSPYFMREATDFRGRFLFKAEDLKPLEEIDK